MNKFKEVLNCFPENIISEIMQNINQPIAEITEEIRIRNNKPIVLKISQEKLILKHIINSEEIEKIFMKICENSIYSYQKQISEGFITIKGGHRIGLTGSAVVENNKIINLNYISSLNFRIAREKKGCSINVLNEIINTDKNHIYNTLIISPPGCGKTTILIDIIRNLSNGIPSKISSKTIGLVDERCEIAAMYKGVPQNDVGQMTDVITNCSKSVGMKMLIRSMAPQIIACDEIGSKDDVQAINSAICSGIKGIFTLHGNNIDEIKKNPELSELFSKNLIEKIIILSETCKGKIEKIYTI